MDLVEVITKENLRITEFPGGSTILDITRNGKTPWRNLSPFHVWKGRGLPVPGMPKTYANSVESIWQGLKVINGQTDTAMFFGQPKKRTGNVDGHRFGEELIGLRDARTQIYVPAYMYMLQHQGKPIVEQLVSKTFDGHLYLVDMSDNLDVADITQPLSHAHILAEYILSRRADVLSRVRKEHDAVLYRQGGGGNLYESVDYLIEHFWLKLKPLEKKAFRVILAGLSASKDIHTARYAGELNILLQSNIKGRSNNIKFEPFNAQ